MARRSYPKLADVARAIEPQADPVIGAELPLPQTCAAARIVARLAGQEVAHFEEPPAELVVRAHTGPTPR